MSKFNKWQEKKILSRESSEWVGNEDNIHSQSGKPYSFVVRVNTESFQYCGQKYEGANNYHSAPAKFIPYISEAIKMNKEKILKDAIGLLESEVNNLGVNAKEEVEKMLAEVNSIAST